MMRNAPENAWSISDEGLQQLADEVMAAWRHAHGTASGTAHALVGPRGLAIVLDGVLSRGELQMAAEPAGQNLLDRYIKGLLNQVCAQQAARLRSLLAREIRTAGVTVDSDAGWVLRFFELAATGESE